MNSQKAIYEFFLQLCQREPGVTLPGTLDKDWESLARPMKISPVEAYATLEAIWQGFYRERPLSAEQQRLLMELNWLGDQEACATQSIKLAKLFYGVAKLTLGYDLAKQLRYRSALLVLEPLASEAAFRESVHWENHLSQKLELVRCSTQPALATQHKGQALLETISKGKRTFENCGQWRASIWQEVQLLKILFVFDRESEFKWLVSTLKEQARYYQWNELDQYLGDTLDGLEQKFEKLFVSADFDSEWPLMMARLSQLKDEGAVTVFIGLSRGLSEKLEEMGRYQEANAVLKGWLEIYQDGGTL